MIRLKNKLMYLLSKTINRPKVNDISKLDNLTIKSSKKNMRYLYNSTFNIIYISGEKSGYFRECRLHLNEKNYLFSIIDDFFYFIEDNIVAKQIILKCLTKKKNRKLFYNMGILNDNYSKLNTFFRNKDYDAIGLGECKYKIDEKIIKKFVSFSWGEIYQYRLNNGIKKNSFQMYNSSKCVATRKFSELIGVSELIPQIRYVKLIIDGQIVKYGTFSDIANGVSFENVTEEMKRNLTTHFLKDIHNLQILDILIFEKDHRPGNYKTILNNNKIIGIQAFDNDSPMCFSVNPSISFYTYMHACPLVIKNKVQLKYLDKGVIDNILNLTYQEIRKKMKNDLTFIQILFLWIRTCNFKFAISKSNVILLKDIEWKDEYIKYEITSNVLTYLNLFLTTNKKN